MVSPETDWWIKNNTQVKKPVYNIKRYAVSVATIKPSAGYLVTFPINQDQNIKLVLCTDYIISIDNLAGVDLLTMTDITKTNDNIVFNGYSNGINTLYINNFNYLCEGENFKFFVNDITGRNIIVTMGYITISSNT